jgi:plasmid stabilization system protein ParE
MSVEPVAAAEPEIAEAVIYYAARSPKAARDFLADFEAAVQRIGQLPNAWPLVGKGLRRCLMSSFPYQIIYRVQGDTIRIYAVAHSKRRPGYWTKRVVR